MYWISVLLKCPCTYRWNYEIISEAADDPADDAIYILYRWNYEIISEAADNPVDDAIYILYLLTSLN